MPTFFPSKLNYILVSVGLNEPYCSYVQALIWSKMSTGLPIEISSSMRNQSYMSFCRLDIDIHKYDFKCYKWIDVSTPTPNKQMLQFSGIFLMYMYMKNERTRNGGMELKFKWSLRGTGQLTVYVTLIWCYFNKFTANSGYNRAFLSS